MSEGRGKAHVAREGGGREGAHVARVFFRKLAKGGQNRDFGL